MTQRSDILARLQAGETVTAESARRLHGVRHLPGTINALRAQGHAIEQIWHSARGLRWSEYRLVTKRSA
jgi:hypothetical protein